MSSSADGHSPTSPSSGPTLAALGWSSRWEPYLAGHDAGTPGRVLRHDGVAVLVGTDLGSMSIALRPATSQLAVGDWVIVGDGHIAAVLPRASLLRRRDPSTGADQLIAANVDTVGIVCGLDRRVSLGRIQRFTSLAWDSGASPLIVLSKADLVDSTADVETELLAHDPGADIVAVSAATAAGLDALVERCAERTIVLVGESGAGKSTLVNALAGDEVVATASVRRGDHKGRHTTTARQLHVLEGNACLIDTPGAREVGLATDVTTIDAGFDDIAELAQACRFRDCAHSSEPGCEVRAAVTDGRLAATRIQAWEELRREAAWAELRDDPVARHRNSRRLGRIHREAQRHKRP